MKSRLQKTIDFIETYLVRKPEYSGLPLQEIAKGLLKETDVEDGDSVTKSLILYPPEETVKEMEVGDTVGFNCNGKHWTITRDE